VRNDSLGEKSSVLGQSLKFIWTRIFDFKFCCHCIAQRSCSITQIYTDFYKEISCNKTQEIFGNRIVRGDEVIFLNYNELGDYFALLAMTET